MEKNSALEKELNDILAGGAFDRLKPFKEAARWTSMTPKERSLLGILFAAEGEQQLRNGDSQALESFDLSCRVAPEDPAVLYRQALAYATQESNIRCLAAACRALQAAVRLSPRFCEAWYGWACTLVRMGLFHGESAYFQDANEKFEAAKACSESVDSAKRFDLHWHWGLCWYYLGKLSGEAHDFYSSVEKYRQALEQGESQSPGFWDDYGNAVTELALLLGRFELFVEVITFYRNAVKLSPDYFDGWYHLACNYLRIYQCTREEACFNLANECFARTAELKPDHAGVWLHWGVLYSTSGKHKQEIEHLHISCEKLARANECEANNPQVLSRWGEAQTLAGSITERLDLLHEAEDKITRSLELCSEDPDSWYIYGAALNELGRYFEDERYYEQAIEKFKYGLTLNINHPLLWYGLSLSHFAIGELRDDVQMVEHAVAYCAKVIESGGKAFPQFWNDWGVALMQLGEMTDNASYVELAIEKFEQALGRVSEKGEKHSSYLEWLYNYGCALDYLGSFNEDAQRHEEAVQILTLVVQQDPAYTQARYNLAMALAHLGALTDEIDCFQKALENLQVVASQDGEEETIWHDWGMTLINFAQLIHDPGHPQHSQRLYEQAEEKLNHSIALGSLQSFYTLACLQSLMGNYAVALHYLERSERANVLPAVDELMHDEWLEDLRQTADFRYFLSNKSDEKSAE